MTTAHSYSIKLSDAERKEIADILSTPGINEKLMRRARVLMLLDDGLSAPDIVRYLQISRSTVYSISQRFHATNLRGALYDGRPLGHAQAHSARRLQLDRIRDEGAAAHGRG